MGDGVVVGLYRLLVALLGNGKRHQGNDGDRSTHRNPATGGHIVFCQRPVEQRGGSDHTSKAQCSETVAALGITTDCRDGGKILSEELLGIRLVTAQGQVGRYTLQQYGSVIWQSDPINDVIAFFQIRDGERFGLRYCSAIFDHRQRFT